MKLIDTRIRAEKSSNKEEYFPEYRLEWKTLFGKVKTEWQGVVDMSSHYFGEAYIEATLCAGLVRGSDIWAMTIIDKALARNKVVVLQEEHEHNKEITYYKYP